MDTPEITPSRRLLGLVLILFTPAMVGLLGQAFKPGVAGQGALALAALALGIEQGKMAIVDLHHIALLSPRTVDPRFRRFCWVTWSTIVLELIGFYAAAVWLGGGVAVVMASQLWFNGLAGVTLCPAESEPLQPAGLQQRLPVLMADVLGLVIVLLWMIPLWPRLMAGLLLVISFSYLAIKYGPTWRLSRGVSQK